MADGRGRKPGDGRGRLGGRAKGTPNKDNPLKGYIAAHSTDYFEPTITVDQQLVDRYAELKLPLAYPIGAQISQFDLDLALMEPNARVEAEIKLLNYHLPKMQTTNVDLSVGEGAGNFDDWLASLADDSDLPPDDAQ